MNTLAPHDRCSLALLTDLYQLTMAYGYWKSGVADRETVFSLFFRKHPFGGGYTIAAGLEQAIDFIERFCFAAPPPKPSICCASSFLTQDGPSSAPGSSASSASGAATSGNASATPQVSTWMTKTWTLKPGAVSQSSQAGLSEN